MTDAESQRLVLQRLYELRISNPNATPKDFQDLQLDDDDLFHIMDQLAQLGLITWLSHRNAKVGVIDHFANAHITALGVRSIEQAMRDEGSTVPTLGTPGVAPKAVAGSITNDISPSLRGVAAVAHPQPPKSDHVVAPTSTQQSVGVSMQVNRAPTEQSATAALGATGDLSANAEVVPGPARVRSVFESKISDEPAAIKDAAQVLVHAIKNQIDELQKSKPNDLESLQRFNSYVAFLEKLAADLQRLIDALDHLVAAKATKQNEPIFIGKVGEVAEQIRINVMDWLKTNQAGVVDFSMKVGFVAAGYNFLHVCGVEGVTASVISGLLSQSFSRKK